MTFKTNKNQSIEKNPVVFSILSFLPCLSDYVLIHLSFCLSICLCVCLAFYWFVFVCAYLPIYWSVLLSINQFVGLSNCLLICLCICLNRKMVCPSHCFSLLYSNGCNLWNSFWVLRHTNWLRLLSAWAPPKIIS